MQATGQCAVSMSREGGGGGAGTVSNRNESMAAGASMGWTAAGVGFKFLERFPDPSPVYRTAHGVYDVARA